MGDLAIMETVGWGGFILGGAWDLHLVGGTFDEALALSREMRRITTATIRLIASPPWASRAPVGIDIRKVVQTEYRPVIDTAIAHREAGHPIIGAGWCGRQWKCFKRAVTAFGER